MSASQRLSEASRLGEFLVRAGVLPAETVQQLLSTHHEGDARLAVALVDKGLVSGALLAQLLSYHLSVPWVSLEHVRFSDKLLAMIPHQIAERYGVIPVHLQRAGNGRMTLYVATDDPTNEEAAIACKRASGLPIRMMVAPPDDVTSAIETCYQTGGEHPHAVGSTREQTVPDGQQRSEFSERGSSQTLDARGHPRPTSSESSAPAARCLVAAGASSAPLAAPSSHGIQQAPGIETQSHKARLSRPPSGPVAFDLEDMLPEGTRQPRDEKLLFARVRSAPPAASHSVAGNPLSVRSAPPPPPPVSVPNTPDASHAAVSQPGSVPPRSARPMPPTSAPASVPASPAVPGLSSPPTPLVFEAPMSTRLAPLGAKPPAPNTRARPRTSANGGVVAPPTGIAHPEPSGVVAVGDGDVDSSRPDEQSDLPPDLSMVSFAQEVDEQVDSSWDAPLDCEPDAEFDDELDPEPDTMASPSLDRARAAPPPPPPPPTAGHTYDTSTPAPPHALLPPAPPPPPTGTCSAEGDTPDDCDSESDIHIDLDEALTERA